MVYFDRFPAAFNVDQAHVGCDGKLGRVLASAREAMIRIGGRAVIDLKRYWF